MTMEELMQKFLVEHRRYAEPALCSSWRKYAERRDELIEACVKATGVPAKEFHNAIAMEMAEELFK